MFMKNYHFTRTLQKVRYNLVVESFVSVVKLASLSNKPTQRVDNFPSILNIYGRKITLKDNDRINEKNVEKISKKM